MNNNNNNKINYQLSNNNNDIPLQRYNSEPIKTKKDAFCIVF